MKKRLLFLQALAAFVLMYPMFAFTFYAWNPADWTSLGRFGYAVMSITLFMALACISIKEAEELDKIDKELKKVSEVMEKFNKKSEHEALGS